MLPIMMPLAAVGSFFVLINLLRGVRNKPVAAEVTSVAAEEEGDVLRVRHQSTTTFVITTVVSGAGLAGLLIYSLTAGSHKDFSLGAPLLLTALGAMLVALVTLFKHRQPENVEDVPYQLTRRGHGTFSASATSALAKGRHSGNLGQTWKEKNADPDPLRTQMLKAVKGAARWDAFVLGLELSGAIVIVIGAVYAFRFWYNS